MYSGVIGFGSGFFFFPVLFLRAESVVDEKIYNDLGILFKKEFYCRFIVGSRRSLGGVQMGRSTHFLKNFRNHRLLWS